MLKNIPECISPDLLKALAEMGHGDEIVIADGNFPCNTNCNRVIRADGIGGEEMLKAILTLLPLDTYSEPNVMLMETVKGDPTPTIWAKYEKIINKADKNAKIGFIERMAFYDHVKEKAFAVIATSEKAVYANVIIKKGVVKNK
ncbi:MAG: fucose isomerase [Bacilli bacterium]|nr:fucose isomerase [Bacilli bacterium]